MTFGYVLSNSEELFISLVAKYRDDFAKKYGAKQDYNKGDSEKNNVAGFAAEFAVARFLKIDPISLIDFEIIGGKRTRFGDVGGYEVRGVTKRHYRLSLRDHDDRSKRYILVDTSGMPALVIRGWANGHDIDVKGEVAKNFASPARCIDNKHLKSIHTLGDCDL